MQYVLSLDVMSVIKFNLEFGAEKDNQNRKYSICMILDEKGEREVMTLISNTMHSTQAYYKAKSLCSSFDPDCFFSLYNLVEFRVVGTHSTFLELEQSERDYQK